MSAADMSTMFDNVLQMYLVYTTIRKVFFDEYLNLMWRQPVDGQVVETHSLSVVDNLHSKHHQMSNTATCLVWWPRPATTLPNYLAWSRSPIN